jgi:membrane associated rhomboid family serine protease
MSVRFVSSDRDASFWWKLGTLGGFIGLIWIISGITLLIPGPKWGVIGIVPRTTDGLAGILAAPFIHGSFDHLLSNTIPLIVLGGLILLRGVNEFLVVLQISILIAGAGTWLLGSGGGHHIGASGVVFGFLGFLLFRTIYNRTISSAIVTVVVAIAYGGTLTSALIPAEGISWSGHFFGFLGGFAAARYRYRRPYPPRSTGNGQTGLRRVH